MDGSLIPGVITLGIKCADQFLLKFETEPGNLASVQPPHSIFALLPEVCGAQPGGAVPAPGREGVADVRALEAAPLAVVVAHFRRSQFLPLQPHSSFASPLAGGKTLRVR